MLILFLNLYSDGITAINKQFGILEDKLLVKLMEDKLMVKLETIAFAYTQLRLNTNLYRMFAVANDEMKAMFHRYSQM